MKLLIPRISRLATLLVLTFGCWSWAAAAQSFDDQLAQAKALFKAGKLDEAQADAQAAAKLDPKRFEAPATLALILHEAKKPDDARAALETATKLAPPDKQEQVQRLAALLGPKKEATAASPAELTGAARRKYDTLLVIIEEAEKAGQDAERKKLLREFLDKSEPFLKEQPDQLALWVTRAVAALELNVPKAGWLAGVQLVRLGADSSEDQKLRKVMASLDRKGWLAADPPAKCLKEFSFDEVRSMAEAGNAAAQGELGSRFSTGMRGAPPNAVEAVTWYRKGADQGNPRAQEGLGRAYLGGYSVSKDGTEGTNWIRKAENGYLKKAEQGDMEALLGLGSLYQYGILRDLERAAKWLKLAAEQGNTDAQHSLGNLYGYAPPNGFGDNVEGVKWYRRAAEAGHAGAQASLGAAYFYGSGVTKDHAEGVKWFRKAVEQNDFFGHEMLGHAFAAGKGVPQDHAEAKKCYWNAYRIEDSTRRHSGLLRGITQTLAELLSKSPDSRVRDGKEAVRLALKVCEAYQWKRDSDLGLLAAAYAEAGDSPQAIRYCEQAIQMDEAKSGKPGSSIWRKDLEDFRAGKPLRKDWKDWY